MRLPANWRQHPEMSLPTYVYACTACGHEFDVVQSITDAALQDCELCGGQLRKVFHPVGVAFKGSGFYRTDSRAASSGDSGKASGAKSDAASTSKQGSSDSSSKKSSSSGTESSGSSSKTSGDSAAKKGSSGSPKPE